MKKLCACMMVRNEQHFLPQCLESIKDYVDDIIILDTGSTDDTIAIAESYGAKVYHSPWQDNFSYHRNESIGYADSEWVLIIDADEKLIAHENLTKEVLYSWLDDVGEKYCAVAININDIQNGAVSMNCNSARIFKKGHIEYKNRVHNLPVFTGAAVLCDMLIIEHYGYDLTKEKMQTKFKRTYNLLLEDLKELDEEGIPKNKDVYFYLCQLLGHHGIHEESREWGRKYIALKPSMDSSKFNTTIYYTMIKSCHDAGLMDEAYKWITEALKEKPTDPDYACALADHGAMLNNHTMMIDGCRRYLKGYKEVMENPAKKAGQFYFSLNDDTVTLNLYRMFMGTTKESAECWRVLKPRLAQKPFKDMIDELQRNLQVLGQTHYLTEIKDLCKLPVENKLLDIYKVKI